MFKYTPNLKHDFFHHSLMHARHILLISRSTKRTPIQQGKSRTLVNLRNTTIRIPVVDVGGNTQFSDTLEIDAFCTETLPMRQIGKESLKVSFIWTTQLLQCAWLFKLNKLFRLMVTFKKVQLQNSHKCLESHIFTEMFEAREVYKTRYCGILSNFPIYSSQSDVLIRFSATVGRPYFVSMFHTVIGSNLIETSRHTVEPLTRNFKGYGAAARRLQWTLLNSSAHLHMVRINQRKYEVGMIEFKFSQDTHFSADVYDGPGVKCKKLPARETVDASGQRQWLFFTSTFLATVFYVAPSTRNPVSLIWGSKWSEFVMDRNPGTYPASSCQDTVCTVLLSNIINKHTKITVSLYR